MTIYDFVEFFFSIICFWNKFSVTLQQISSKWNKKVKSEMSKVKNLIIRLLLNPHFQTFSLSLNTWTISPSNPAPRRSLPSPTPHFRPMSRRDGTDFHPEGIPKAKQKQSEDRASGAIVFSHPKWQHAIINNHQPPSKELKHKQQRLKDEPTLKSKACLKCLYFTNRLLLATPTRPSKPSQSRAPDCDGESHGTTKLVGVTLKTKTLKPIS